MNQYTVAVGCGRTMAIGTVAIGTAAADAAVDNAARGDVTADGLRSRSCLNSCTLNLYRSWSTACAG